MKIIVLILLSRIRFLTKYAYPLREQILTKGSVVSCYESPTSRKCIFENVCYVNSELILFGENGTSGTINISGVPNHTAMFLRYHDDVTELPASFYGSAKFYAGQTLIMRRFLADNLMHVIHDDLLPLFATLQEDSGIEFVAFADNYEKGLFWHLYEVTIGSEPILLSEFSPEQPVCFETAVLGLSNSTLWYQYGFGVPQGSLKNPNLNGSILSEFRHYLLYHLQISLGKQMAKKVALLSRQDTRKILNENDLTFELSRKFQATVKKISLENYSVMQLISEVATAQIIVGMHGSLLALALFLPQNTDSLVVELFPFGVNPDHYTPYQTLAEVMGLNYVAWRNWKYSSTVSHPEYPKELGGIWHLPTEIQKKIVSSNEVPMHLCCSDPEWLYRIYQDTTVDISEILNIIELHAHSL